MKAGRTLQELAVELDRQNAAKKDYIVDAGALTMTTQAEPQLLVGGGSYPVPYGITDIAHRQIGSFLKIPATYYDRMRRENPGLLAQNVNAWFEDNGDTKRMLRTMDGSARALLSDRYRRIDNFEIASAVLPIIGGIEDARVESCELTDSRMYIKVVSPRTQAEVKVGDPVQAGVIVTNSEVGYGSVTVKPLIFRLVCSNGMVAESGAMRKYHVGRVNEANEDLSIFRDETIQASDKAFLMRLEDSVRAAVSQTSFEKIVGQMREATEAKIKADTVPQVIELASKEYGFTENEGKGILGHLISGGDLSLYGLANAVTRHAQDVESYDRSTELEAAGYQIITMSPVLWRQMERL
jgi:hypothetical protein